VKQGRAVARRNAPKQPRVIRVGPNQGAKSDFGSFLKLWHSGGLSENFENLSYRGFIRNLSYRGLSEHFRIQCFIHQNPPYRGFIGFYLDIWGVYPKKGRSCSLFEASLWPHVSRYLTNDSRHDSYSSVGSRLVLACNTLQPSRAHCQKLYNAATHSEHNECSAIVLVCVCLCMWLISSFPMKPCTHQKKNVRKKRYSRI